MSIAPLPPIVLSPREDMVHDIMMLLDEATNSEQEVGVIELAERIVSSIEPSDEDSERLRIFVTNLAFEELDAAGRMSLAHFDELEVSEGAAAIGCVVRDEVLRGSSGWRHTPDAGQRAYVKGSWRPR